MKTAKIKVEVEFHNEADPDIPSYGLTLSELEVVIPNDLPLEIWQTIAAGITKHSSSGIGIVLSEASKLRIRQEQADLDRRFNYHKPEEKADRQRGATPEAGATPEPEATSVDEAPAEQEDSDDHAH